jgi:hypothetical protein
MGGTQVVNWIDSKALFADAATFKVLKPNSNSVF